MQTVKMKNLDISQNEANGKLYLWIKDDNDVEIEYEIPLQVVGLLNQMVQHHPWFKIADISRFDTHH